jgi:non-canonical (house-cleaning) NTP pyrophosphatase
MKILIGTTSLLKLKALNDALDYLRNSGISEKFDIESVETESGVPATPYNEQTLLGARNRINSMLSKVADLYIGLESGLIERDKKLFEECWCVISDKNRNESIGISSAIQLPDIIVDGLKDKKKHTDLLDELGESLNISSKDTWGVYSKGKLSRSVSMYEACRNALVNYFIKH